MAKTGITITLSRDDFASEDEYREARRKAYQKAWFQVRKESIRNRPKWRDVNEGTYQPKVKVDVRREDYDTHADFMRAYQKAYRTIYTQQPHFKDAKKRYNREAYLRRIAQREAEAAMKEAA